jgi:hypothetical protein
MLVLLKKYNYQGVITMSSYRFNEWSKRTERFEHDTSNSSLWNDSPAEDHKKIKQIKQKWQQQQQQQFKRIQQHDLHRKNTKAVVSTLITLAIIAFCVPYLPGLVKMTRQTIAESFSPDSEVVNSKQNGASDKKSPGILQRLKELEAKSKSGNFQDNCPESENGQVCQPGEGVVNDNGDNTGPTNKPPTLSEQAHQSITQIEDYNKKLQQAIDMSDGK